MEKKIKPAALEEALRLSPRQTAKLYAKHLNSINSLTMRFLGTTCRFVKAAGISLIDQKGKEYFDFSSGFGALNLGHEPPEVLAAVARVSGLPNVLQMSLNPFAAKLAEVLAEVTPGSLCRSFFCNSGTEAVEAAIKLARCAGKKKTILYAEKAFHGKTFGSLSVSGKDKYKEPFLPLLPKVKKIPYNQSAALEKEIKSNGDIAAFIVEPVQGEAGVIVPDFGYLKKVRQICSRYGVFLILDEVQTGIGRTGKLFCCQHEAVEPDIICLSKSLGGGVMPLGAMVTTNFLWQKAYGSLSHSLLHTSTLGGNSKACAAGLATLDSLKQRDLPGQAARQGSYFLQELKALAEKSPLINQVRGKGLMLGVNCARLKGKTPLTEGALTFWLVRRLFRKHNIIAAFTLNNYDVLRVMPPLDTGKNQIDYFLEAFSQCLKKANLLSRFNLLKANHD